MRRCALALWLVLLLGAGARDWDHRPPREAVVLDSRPFLTMEFVKIPAGTFTMGPPPWTRTDNPFTKDREEVPPVDWSAEMPAHQVKVAPFHISRYEVTQYQWYQVMGYNPSGVTRGLVPQTTENYPVDSVSWEEVQEFVRRLNERDQAMRVRYRLPTEAEWEYACRGGTQMLYGFADDAKELGQYAWYAENSPNGTRPVGLLRPNSFGLYDMHGNVLEWCADWYRTGYRPQPKPVPEPEAADAEAAPDAPSGNAADLTAEQQRLLRFAGGGSVPDLVPATPEPDAPEPTGELPLQQDPTGPRSGLNRVARGGAWNLTALDAACGRRVSVESDGKAWNLGFRLVMEPLRPVVPPRKLVSPRITDAPPSCSGQGEAWPFARPCSGAVPCARPCDTGELVEPVIVPPTSEVIQPESLLEETETPAPLVPGEESGAQTPAAPVIEAPALPAGEVTPAGPASPGPAAGAPESEKK